jgi:rare lipoprotein A
MKLMMGVQRFAFAILRNDMNQYRDVTDIVQPGIATLNGVSIYQDRLPQQKINLCDLTRSVRRTVLIVISGILISSSSLIAQDTKLEKDKKEKKEKEDKEKKEKTRILYGTASFYSNKFQGRKTANGEIFDQKKMTAACNVLPLGTWIRVTNLRNKKSVIVKINDRLHTKMKRIVDLSRVAADKLNYIRSGLTRVKVEVLGKKKPD